LPITGEAFTAEQQNSRTAEQQNSRTAEQQSVRNLNPEMVIRFSDKPGQCMHSQPSTLFFSAAKK